MESLPFLARGAATAGMVRRSACFNSVAIGLNECFGQVLTASWNEEEQAWAINLDAHGVDLKSETLL
jgi:hypothetical protein